MNRRLVLLLTAGLPPASRSATTVSRAFPDRPQVIAAGMHRLLQAANRL